MARYDKFRKLTGKAFGKGMALHDMRRSAATHLAIDCPDKVGLIPAVLQHKNGNIRSTLQSGELRPSQFQLRFPDQIEAQDKTREGDLVMRVAIYARYSSDLQSEASIEDQVEVCKRLAKAQGWQVVDVY